MHDRDRTLNFLFLGRKLNRKSLEGAKRTFGGKLVGELRRSLIKSSLEILEYVSWANVKIGDAEA